MKGMISVERRTSKPMASMPPLMNGDHLDQHTFHERYEAMPGVRAELIGGIVFMSSPQKLRHGFHHRRLAALVNDYVDETPGTEACVSSTAILGDDAEPQPDAFMYILPEHGGQASEKDGYLTGAPEWVGEIADSTESIDLNRKKSDYEKAGVREYMAAAVRTGELFWFVRRRGKFKRLPADADRIVRSEVFPGFWLDMKAFLEQNGQQLRATLRCGLASSEHAAFVAKLTASRKTS